MNCIMIYDLSFSSKVEMCVHFFFIFVLCAKSVLPFI